MERWDDGGGLATYRVAAPAARAAVLVVHGFGEHAGRHERTMDVFARNGIVSYAYDHRGHGRSPGIRGLVLSFDDLVDDALRLRDAVATREPGLPLFLFGVSMGGLVAARSMQRRPEGLRGAVLIAPAFQLAARRPPRAVFAGLRVLAAVLPGLGAAKLNLRHLSRSDDVAAAYAADPLTHGGAVPLRTATEMVLAGDAALAGAARATVPTLIVQGDADRIIAPAGAQRYAAASAGRARVRTVAGGYHEPLNDPGGDELRAEIAAWILAQV